MKKFLFHKKTLRTLAVLMAGDKGVLILSDPDNHPPAFDNRDACLAAGTIDDDREAFHLSLVIHASAVAS
jgi:hypothetical protein